MLLEELQKLVAAGESENLEFKKTTGQRTEAAKTVCALLNGLGGFLLFGVSDRGEITGQQVTAKNLEDISLKLRRVEGRVVPGKMIREDYPLYPPLATREALANSICHRDYTTPGGAVAIAMYDDHLEIINPRIFHFGMTPEKLTRPHESKPWNPIIASVFYRAGVIEKWGMGTLNIIKSLSFVY